MGSFYLSPVGGIIFAVIMWSWYILIGWLGRYLVCRRNWPWPATAILQGVLAAQIYLMAGPMMFVDAECCRDLLPALEEISRWFLGSAFIPFGIMVSLQIDWPQFPQFGDSGFLMPVESTVAVYCLIYAIQHIIGKIIDSRKRKVAAI